MIDFRTLHNTYTRNNQRTSSIPCTQATKSLDLLAAEILASRQEVKMEDEEEEDEKKPFIDIVLEETEVVGP